MRREPKLIVRNVKSKISNQDDEVQKSEVSLPFIVSQESHSKNSTHDVAERLKKLQGNLKMLEKQYRANLKQGFDHKIKAYRLEAVVERKLMKEALNSVKDEKQREYIQNKIRNNSEHSLQQSRVEVMKADREHRRRALKQRLSEERKGYTLSLYERQIDEKERAKQIHDKIQQQSEKVTLKRDYFRQLREEEARKQQNQLKNSLVERIVSNTQKLKALKTTLESLKEHEINIEKTFLTI